MRKGTRILTIKLLHINRDAITVKTACSAQAQAHGRELLICGAGSSFLTLCRWSFVLSACESSPQQRGGTAAASSVLEEECVPATV